MTTQEPTTRARSRRALSKGESLVASVGLVGTLLVTASVGAAGWWTLRTDRAARTEVRAEQVRAVATVLSDTASSLLANGDVSALRTLATGVAANSQLETVQIRLAGANGQVVADGNPQSGFKYAALPETWPTGDVPSECLTTGGEGGMVVRCPVIVPGRGAAVLEVRDTKVFPLLASWQAQAGIGAIGAAGLVGVLCAYRLAKRRFRALGAISESLDALRTGENDPSVLAVSAEFGREAAAWNQMLGEMTKLRAQLTQDKAAGQLGNRRGRDGDLSSLCDAMWQGLIMIDDQMKIKYVNGAAAVFLRGKREEMIGVEIAKFIGEQKPLEAIRAVATGQNRSRTIVEVERAGGEAGASNGAGGGARQGTVLRFSVRPVRKEDSASAVVVVEDVTQQRIADESRNAFVASATHELRTPLTNIRLYVDGLLEEPDQDVASRTKAVNVISGEVRRLERMVGDLLSVAQIEAGQIKLNAGDVRLEPVFEELRHDFEEQAKQKEIGLKFDLPPKWPQMSGDRDKIVMALHNLVGNAIKYTPAGGQVTVRANADGQAFTVDVTDNGIGIKDDEQPLIFDKFYRAKDRRIANITGTGLGLSIAREVVRLHGGDITLRSQIDKGSTFTMVLPAKAA